MSTNLLTVRCPTDVLQAIEERGKISKQSKTEVVLQLLKAGLEATSGVKQPVKQLDFESLLSSIESRLTSLEGRFEALQNNEMIEEQSFESSNKQELKTKDLAVLMRCDSTTLTKAIADNRIPYRNNGFVAQPVKRLGKTSLWEVWEE